MLNIQNKDIKDLFQNYYHTSRNLFMNELIFFFGKSNINYGTRDLRECSNGIQVVGKIHPAQGNKEG